jgi:hypothetical protein
MISFVLLVATAGLVLFAGIKLIRKTSSKLKRTAAIVKESIGPRSGETIYIALFGRPQSNCLQVVHYKDQLVPRLDCCIWLEFKTCPSELTRIIAADEVFRKIIPDVVNTTDAVGYTPMPGWWQPSTLGDARIVLRDFNPGDPNHDRILTFSKDSLHAFYCDMAE